TPSDVRGRRWMENLGRGVVALSKGGGQVYVGWRLLGTDPAGIAFNLYRNGTRLNASPITESTNWLDTGVNTAIANTYYVRPVLDGVEGPPSGAYTLAPNPPTSDYPSVRLPLQPVPNAVGNYFVYHVFPGDLDGDGEYELVVARESDALATYKVLEAYRLDGTLLWRVNLGPNVQYTHTVVYDFDSDGRAEVLTKTGESTVFADGTAIGDTDGDGITDYRVIGRQYEIWDGPEFLSMIDGLTGCEIDRTDFIPRGDILDWGDDYGHRASFINEGVAYLDGVHPSAVFCRGPGDYMKIAAWDFLDGHLKLRWTWFNRNHEGLPADQLYADFHQWRLVDVDGDGKDEICLGGSVIDDDGTPLYGTELTHGDRFQIADFDPDRPGLEAFAIQQYNPTLLGAAYYDAGTGEMLAKYYGDGPDPWDVGRGDAGDYDPDYKGLEFFSTMNGMYNCKGEKIYDEHPFPTLGIWWDGDLLREFFVGVGSTGRSPALEKWNPAARSNSLFLPRLYNDGGSYYIICPWAGRPPFLGDILGDWREEVVLETADHSQLRIYSSTHLTPYRIYTLMQNPYYRLDVTHKGYLVTTYTDYYLGVGMETPPPPYIRPVHGPAPQTGKITRQWWSGIPGSSVADLTSQSSYPDSPSGTQYVGHLEGPLNAGDAYGSRICGFLVPPQSGFYTFWIAADDSAELRLSSDALEQHAAVIASVPAWTAFREWNKYPAQQSAPIYLKEGCRYFIEAVHKEGNGADHLSVAWQRDGTDRPQVIDGVYLMPWDNRTIGDMTGDRRVDLQDIEQLSRQWQVIDRTMDLKIDINGDGKADLTDLALLAGNWLAEP
ncbi:MAG TPA: PA14 domain-containing protein, partial [Anaerohalosphaeraceae bacterium]|nr:PA14 domain-containing protein [Anaerohalosphaeraceae bacterium]